MFLSLEFGSSVGSIKAIQVRPGAATDGPLQLEPRPRSPLGHQHLTGVVRALLLQLLPGLNSKRLQNKTSRQK